MFQDCATKTNMILWILYALKQNCLCMAALRFEKRFLVSLRRCWFPETRRHHDESQRNSKEDDAYRPSFQSKQRNQVRYVEQVGSLPSSVPEDELKQKMERCGAHRHRVQLAALLHRAPSLLPPEPWPGNADRVRSMGLGLVERVALFSRLGGFIRVNFRRNA